MWGIRWIKQASLRQIFAVDARLPWWRTNGCEHRTDTPAHTMLDTVAVNDYDAVID